MTRKQITDFKQCYAWMNSFVFLNAQQQKKYEMCQKSLMKEPWK